MPSEAVVLKMHKGDQMFSVSDYEAKTREELAAQLAAVEACRDFWYRAFVRASTYAVEQIDAAVAHARVKIGEDNEQCVQALKDMERQINTVIRMMFVMDGRKTGSDAVLPSSVSRPGNSS